MLYFIDHLTGLPIYCLFSSDFRRILDREDFAMGHYEINHDPTPIRLFKSDFLEFFTHISPVTVTIIWLPFAGYMLVSEILAGLARGDSLWYILAAFLIGLFLWTFAEYNLHRFVFHF